MSPTAPTLPAGSQLGFSYEYGVDIDLGTPGAPVWQPLRRITAVTPSVTPVMAAAQTYDDFGADNQTRTSESWTLAFSELVNRLSSTGAYTPEVEALKALTEPDALGALAIGHFRWYDKPAAGPANVNDAYEGYATVGLERANSGNADVGMWGFTLTGVGKRIKITNPFGGWGASKPSVASALPVSAAVGTLVTLTGANFATATGVKFGAVSATTFSIVGGSTIVAVMPAGTAGSAPVTVINPTGTSDALEYIRGA
jgi:hypothetical protein